MRQVLQTHLKRVTWDDMRLPIRLHPFVAREGDGEIMAIAIDARIAFGRPVIISRGISTAAIVARIDAGKTVADLAADYDISPAEIEDAVLYEQVA